MIDLFRKFAFISSLFLALGYGSSAFAYTIENLKEVPIENNFVLGGGKVELYLSPGEKYIKEITVTNRLGKDMRFKIEVEDFKGSRDPEKSIVFLGGEKGPYSLRDYLKIETTEFSLKHGQQMILPVEVYIPPNAEPGGLYGSILVSANPSLSQLETEAEKARGQMSLITRLGSLFFVRIKGEAKEDGLLKDFKVEKDFYEKGQISFKIFFENNGNVHLAPNGKIEIKNIFGKKVGEIEVDRYFAMPDSIKFREMKWNRGLLFGRYTAFITLNRGYNKLADQKEVSFWFLPWKIVLGGMLVLFVVIAILRWILRNFEFKRKP